MARDARHVGQNGGEKGGAWGPVGDKGRLIRNWRQWGPAHVVCEWWVHWRLGLCRRVQSQGCLVVRTRDTWEIGVDRCGPHIESVVGLQVSVSVGFDWVGPRSPFPRPYPLSSTVPLI